MILDIAKSDNVLLSLLARHCHKNKDWGLNIYSVYLYILSFKTTKVNEFGIKWCDKSVCVWQTCNNFPSETKVCVWAWLFDKSDKYNMTEMIWMTK